jgi:aspartyl protease family protein
MRRYNRAMAQSTGSVVGALLFGMGFLILALPDKTPQRDEPSSPTHRTESDPAEGGQFIGPDIARPNLPADRPTPQPTRQAMSNAYGPFSVQRSPDSHFYVDADVNGTTVHFLVDTGASGVVLAAADAQRLGISGDNFTVSAMSAGGEIKLMPAMVDRLALGPLVADDVPVLVAKDKLPISLLGQSYLSRVGTVAISGDTMTLQ